MTTGLSVMGQCRIKAPLDLAEVWIIRERARPVLAGFTIGMMSGLGPKDTSLEDNPAEAAVVPPFKLFGQPVVFVPVGVTLEPVIHGDILDGLVDALCELCAASLGPSVDFA